jgi:hypothetical protein
MKIKNPVHAAYRPNSFFPIDQRQEKFCIFCGKILLDSPKWYYFTTVYSYIVFKKMLSGAAKNNQMFCY